MAAGLFTFPAMWNDPLGVIRVVGMKGDRVRLAFDFPREVDVHRREIADQIVADRPQVVGKLKPTASDDYEIAVPAFIQRYDERFKGLDRLAESELDLLVPVQRADPDDRA